jgi:hypothetical protein
LERIPQFLAEMLQENSQYVPSVVVSSIEIK